MSPHPWSRQQDEVTGQWDILDAQGKLLAIVASTSMDDAIVIESCGELCAILQELCLDTNTIGKRSLLMQAVFLLSRIRSDVVKRDNDGSLVALPLQPDMTIHADKPDEIARAESLYRKRNTRTTCRIVWEVEDRNTGETLKKWENERVVGAHAFIPDKQLRGPAYKELKRTLGLADNKRLVDDNG